MRSEQAFGRSVERCAQIPRYVYRRFVERSSATSFVVVPGGAFVMAHPLRGARRRNGLGRCEGGCVERTGGTVVVEVDSTGRVWVKSSASGGNINSDCVEIAVRDSRIAVRSSRNRSGEHLSFTGSSWLSFLSDLKSA